MLNLERRVNKNCLFVAIALTLNIVIYMVYPKSDYMLLHLEGKEQVQMTFDIYKEMKLKKFGNTYIFCLLYEYWFLC